MAASTLVLVLIPAVCFAGTWRANFELPSPDDWAIFNFAPEVEDWKVANGRAEGRIDEPQFYSLYMLRPPRVDVGRWSDYDVQVRTRLVQSVRVRTDSSPYFGISLYDDGVGNGYVCQLVQNVNRAQIQRRAEGSFDQVSQFLPIEEDTWYDLSASVRREGAIEVVTFQVDDGPPVTMRSADLLGSGGIALIVADGRAQFDNLVVSGPNIANSHSPNSPSIRIVSPEPDHVFPYGTQSVTLTVDTENYNGNWHQNWWTEFPETGEAQGDNDAPSSRSTMSFSSGFQNGTTYRTYVTLVDDAGNVIPSSIARDRIAFSIAGDTERPTIVHNPVKLALRGHDIRIAAVVDDDVSGVRSAALHYRPAGEAEFTRERMERSGDDYTATVPSNAAQHGFSYYIYANDRASNGQFSPRGGASNPIAVPVTGSFQSDDPHPRRVWQLFSLPGKPKDRDISEDLDASVGEGNWAAAVQSGGGTKRAVPRPRLGRAIWLTADGAFSPEVRMETVDPASPVTISLERGWNLVSNPFTYPIPWGNVQVFHVGTKHTYSLTDANVNSAMLRTRYWRWDDSTANDVTDGRYTAVEDPASLWLPWEGYWVRALSPVALLVPPDRDLLSDVQAGPRREFTWSVDLIARASSSSAYVTAGVIPDGLVDYDQALDVEQPPLPGDVLLSLMQGDTQYQRLGLSVPPSQALDVSWLFTVQSPAGALLSVEPRGMPSRARMYVEDTVTGERTLVDEGRAFEVGPGLGRYRLRVTSRTLGTDVTDIVPHETAIFPNYPNPFNPETWIPFALAESGDVHLFIYDLNGTRIRSIDVGYLEPGRYSEPSRAIHWDGRNDLGERVASGMYLIELRATGRGMTRRVLLAK